MTDRLANLLSNTQTNRYAEILADESTHERTKRKKEGARESEKV